MKKPGKSLVKKLGIQYEEIVASTISHYNEYGNISKIARLFNVSSDTIRRILKRNNVKLLHNLGGAKKFDKH